MKKLLFILPVVFFVAAACTSQTPAANGNNNQTANPATAASGPKFTDQSYFKDSYLISSDTLSSQAQKAINGFQLSKQANADGTTQINLKALEAGYHDQQYTLKAGQQLYFIEEFPGDDNNGKDETPVDDKAVVVDGQGSVVQPPQGF